MSAPFDAIIIIDLQRAFAVPEDLLDRIERESLYFPQRIFTKFINHPGSLFRTKLKRHLCAPGSEEAELILKVNHDDWTIEKPGYGLPSEQVKRIASAGIKKTLLCGVDTDACVLGVAFSLFDGGVDCEINPELCWSSAGLHHSALQIIREQFAAA
jgi:nicotinamidase-related amidase